MVLETDVGVLFSCYSEIGDDERKMCTFIGFFSLALSDPWYSGLFICPELALWCVSYGIARCGWNRPAR